MFLPLRLSRLVSDMTQTKHRQANLSPREILTQTLPPFTHIEVREKRDGSWSVWYPDPGWIPCAANCRLNEVLRGHKHDRVQPWIETHYTPTSYEDALVWAELLAEGRDVRVVKFMTIGERNAIRASPASAKSKAA